MHFTQKSIIASGVGLALNVWEFSITLCDEVNLVWLFVDHLVQVDCS
jgi:hypothetical protein